jgi:hypothetical protein
MYLSELVFIEDGNATFVSNPQLINFKKFSLIAKVISEVQQFQRQPCKDHNTNKRDRDRERERKRRAKRS